MGQSIADRPDDERRDPLFPNRGVFPQVLCDAAEVFLLFAGE